MALFAMGANVVFLACDEDGPSPIGDHAADEDSGGEPAKEDAAPEASSADAEPDAGEDPDSGEQPVDAGTDAGDAGKIKDASDADADR